VEAERRCRLEIEIVATPAEAHVILQKKVIASPIGQLTLVARNDLLIAVDFESEDFAHRWLTRRFGPLRMEDHDDPAGAASALRAYFDGELAALDRVPVDPGGTEFQREIWSALRAIPIGTTISYSRLATRVGRPSAVRAVGAANGSNPIPVIIPCHRVIAADGTLCGYGGGIDRKRWLLAHEGALPKQAAKDSARSRQMPLW
jgi:methylated-DNA-[protein]-cysteine S-methyltransferase